MRGYGPSEPAPRRDINGALVFGVILMLVAIWFLLDEYVRIDTDVLWPAGPGGARRDPAGRLHEPIGELISWPGARG